MKHSKNNHHILSAVLLLSMLSPALSFAERIEYNVEILIFEDTTAKYINSEKWPNNTIKTDDVKKIAVLTEIINTEPTLITNVDTEFDIYANDELEQEAGYPVDNNVINIIDIQQEILSEQAKVLNRSSRYNILLHKAWRQTGLDKNSVINIPIDSKDFSFKSAAQNNSLIDIGSLEHNATESIQSYVEGNITIELARYLHFYTDLTYHKLIYEVSPLDNQQLVQTKAFSIETHRRMRSKKLHYIDHPLMGILVMVIPVEVRNEIEGINDPKSSNTLPSGS